MDSGGFRSGILGMSNYNWGSLKGELRLWLMDFERKLRPGIEEQPFLLWKWLSWVRSCKRQAIEQNGSMLKKAGIQKENAGDRDEEDKSNEGLGLRCLRGSLRG